MIRPGTWQSPTGFEEQLLASDCGSSHRLLLVPPLFDEHNKLRHFIVETMRLLEKRQIASFLPDLPGCNESPVSLDGLSLRDWRDFTLEARKHCKATHVLAIRAGCLFAPTLASVAHFAPLTGKALLRSMIRARLLADREAGQDTSRDALVASARENGIQLGGYQLSATMFNELESADPAQDAMTISQSGLSGPALWLRAEPSHDAAQAQGLADLVAEWMN